MDRAAPGTYHVYNRGRGGRNVFRDDDDRLRFLDILKAELLRRGARETTSSLALFAKCLMTSHYHLLLRQRFPGLIAGLMQSVISTYTRYFNRRHGTRGRLFDNPYRSVRITDEKQFKWTVAYVHDNHPSGPGYRFSSHYAYLHPDACPPWLEAETALTAFGGRDSYLAYLRRKQQRAELNAEFF